MMRNTKAFSAKVITLSCAAALLTEQIQGTQENVFSARAFFLGGFPLAVGLVIVPAVIANSGFFSEETLCSRFARAAFLLWFVVELGNAVLDTQAVCWEQFSSMAVLGVLPLLLMAGWTLSPDVFSRTAKILWVFLVIGMVICIAGLHGQFRWENLLEMESEPLRLTHSVSVPLYAEYFVPQLFPQKTTAMQSSHKIDLLPLDMFLIEGGYRLGIELLFGSAENYSGVELLRAWTLGMFSRLDSLFLLVWLAATLFRICFLTRVIRMMAERFRGVSIQDSEVLS